MNLIIDANIVFSALIKKGFTQTLIFDENLKLYSPDFLYEELINHKDLVIEKSRISEEQITKIIDILINFIEVIPKEVYSTYIDNAKNITPDENDTMYFALALKLKCPIWSNDKKLKNQDKVNVYTTQEIYKIIKMIKGD